MRSLILILFCIPSLCLAELRLSSIFGDHMVLQQQRPIPVWGWSEAGAEVTGSLGEETQRAVANAEGRWQMSFAARKAGGEPLELHLRSGETELRFRDILMGEVWICSGQSNMDWAINRSGFQEETLADADQPELRLYRVARQIAHEADLLGRGRWQLSTPKSAAGFSAVGWNFGRELLRQSQVPVGLIHVAWGGTYIEAWTPMASLQEHEFMLPRIEQYDQDQKQPLADEETLEELQQQLKELKFLQDPGNRGFFFGWSQPEKDDSSWQTQKLPEPLEKLFGKMDGAVWYRKRVAVPQDWEGEELLLELGAIDDFDISYVNGVEVGRTGKETEQYYAHPRVYSVPAELVKAGEDLLIAVRVFDHFGEGGFQGGEEAMQLRRKSDAAGAISLLGDWKAKVELRQLELHSAPLVRRLQPGPNRPAVLYKGMIAHLVPFPLQGAIWYQGESNSGRPQEYHELFPGMIQSWRDLWQDPELEFYYVQLANFRELQTKPSEGGWALIREAQQAALKLPGTAEAVILDVGDAEDIHPQDKRTPGLRLARHALAQVYGMDLPHQHPRFSKMVKQEDGSVLLSFRGSYGELKSRDGEELTGFALRAEEQPWVWAQVELLPPDQIRLRHPQGLPVQDVRYAWANNPIGNVVNRIGYPMAPFRTDAPEPAQR